MKWLIGGLFVSGCALLWLGNKALNEPNQSADVRIGGMIPVTLGLRLIGFDAILTIGWLVVKA